MNPLILVVAAIAAIAVLLIFLGVFGGSAGSGVGARLERYAAAEPERAAPSDARSPFLPRETTSGWPDAYRSSRSLTSPSRPPRRPTQMNRTATAARTATPMVSGSIPAAL